MPTLAEKIRNATMDWVATFNTFPYTMIEFLIEHDRSDAWSEVTTPQPNDDVYVFSTGRKGKIERITKNKEGNKKYWIQLDNDTEIKVTVKADEETTKYFDVIYETKIPCWGALWNFKSIFDIEWIEKKENQELMSQCGFRILRHEEWGYFFGIDGGGYDFYEGHWIPLYKKRGLQWHKNR